MIHKCLIVVPGAEKTLQAFIRDREAAEKWCVDNLQALGEKGRSLKAQIYVEKPVLDSLVSLEDEGAKIVVEKVDERGVPIG